MFVLQNNAPAELDLPGLSVQPLGQDTLTAKFDLALSAAEDRHGLRLDWEYATDLFADERIARLAEHFAVLLEGIVDAPGGDIHRLPVLPEAEVRRLAQWNATEVDLPQDRTVVDLFEMQVAATPNHIAVVFEEERLSYRDLNARANRLAHALIARGVGPDGLVALCVERSIEMVVGLLGILKAGGAYVPLDPAYPEERLKLMLEDCAAPVLITQRALLEEMPESRAQTLLLDPTDTFATFSADNPARRSSPGHLAYVIYTSGSTGRPKGVVLSHGALSNLIAWHRQVPELRTAARTLQFTSLSFDVSFQELFATWATGGELVLVADAIRRDAKALLAYLEHYRIERLFVPFVALQHLAETAEGPIAPPLRDIVTAGEQLKLTPALRRWLTGTSCRLHNHYGPTEGHVVTSYLVPTGATDLPPIGKPIANTRIHILDADLNPQPIGVPGELCIAGAGLARGYLNRPELTAEKFVEVELFGRIERLYRTGDLARWREDGNIELLGRIDHQVKLRGFRIELGEVEAALTGHPAVAEAVVVLRETGDGGFLAAYVTVGAERGAAPGSRSTATEELSAGLRTHLTARLPAYMVPASYTVLERMPLTPNGKIDRKRLPDPEAPTVGAGAYAAPRDVTELALVQIWEDLLGLRPIGVNHGFFELGGHSLLAVRLMDRIERHFGEHLPLSVLLEAPTIAELSRRLQHGTAVSGDPLLIPLNRTGSQVPLFYVPGAGGHVLTAYPLATRLGVEQPLFGLQTPGLDDKTAIPESLEAHAGRLEKTVLRHQPRGPYRLAGYSSGGKLAYELARRLERDGHRVAQLIIFDTPATRPTPEQLAKLDARSEHEEALEIVTMLERAYKGRLGMDTEALEGLDAQSILKQLVGRALQRDLMSKREAASFERRVAVKQQCERNQVVYTCDEAVDCPIVLFRNLRSLSDDLPDYLKGEDWGWQSCSRLPVLVHWTDANHNTLLKEPHIEMVAEKIQRHERAHQREPVVDRQDLPEVDRRGPE
jgi:amino acid adenylation domain-containing protein